MADEYRHDGNPAVSVIPADMESLRSALNIWNLCFYLIYMEADMACKDCPKYGFVDTEFEECQNCGYCLRGGK